METLEVTDEQYAFIQQLREEISRNVVGPYGYVRERDAVQFLIDNLDGGVEVDVEFTDSATDDVAASVGRELAGEGTVSYEGLDDGEGAESVTVDGEESGDGAGESDAGAETEAVDDAEAEAVDDAEAEAVDDADDESTDDGTAGEGDASDDDMLDRMMSLLETHDDKWAESPAADYRYRVDLPDGTTEDVQTKDDVRALLFKNY